MLPLSQIAAITGLSITISLISLIIAFRMVISPNLVAVIDEKTQEANDAITKGMSALGNKGRESRDANKMEKMMVSDIMEEYPLLQMAIDFFSPDTAELIEENPERALKIMMRYKPIIDELLGTQQGSAREIYDL